MKFAVALPTNLMSEFHDGQPSMAVLARAAEAAGYDALSVTDHPCPTGRWLDNGGHLAPDPFVALGVAAAVTRKILVQTAILVVPYRNPFITARAATSLDIFSGGRLILGVGVGYLKGEYRAVGADHDARNDITDEYLAALKAAWSNEEFTFKGTGYEALGNRILPRALQDPHPPIWVGGNSRRAIRRAVDYGDAWMPFHLPSTSPVTRTARTVGMGDDQEMTAGLAYLKHYAEKQGRTRPLAVCLDSFHGPAGGSADETLADLDRLARQGVSWVGMHIQGRTIAEWCDNADRYAADIMRNARSLVPA